MSTQTTAIKYAVYIIGRIYGAPYSYQYKILVMRTLIDGLMLQLIFLKKLIFYLTFDCLHPSGPKSKTTRKNHTRLAINNSAVKIVACRQMF